MALHFVPFFVQKLFPSFIWQIPTEEKVIYLTFDDGPIPEITEFVLEELSRYHAKASFFCVGDNIRKHPHVFKKIVESGHSIGNHTFNHLKGWSVSDQTYYRNLAQFEEELQKQGYMPTNLFRPPYGRIKVRQGKQLANKYKIVMWNVLSCDYDASLPAEKCLRKTIHYTKPGSIVLFHDSLKSEKNLRFVLPHYLAYFAGKGYRFASL